MYTFICEDSIDGIFTGVYDAWSFKIDKRITCQEDIHLSCKDSENYQLFEQYVTVDKDFDKAAKVSRTLQEKLGYEFYETIISAALATCAGKYSSVDKADAVYQTIALALRSKEGARVLQYLKNPYVYRIFELSRAAGSEAHHLMGFLRFEELKNGVLFARIHPKNNALPYLAEHFTDRFPCENFLIYDENRKLAAVHKAGANYMLVDASDINEAMFHSLSDKEEAFQKLWLTFFENIEIRARKNPKLQAANIPKRFWQDTVELRT